MSATVTSRRWLHSSRSDRLTVLALAALAYIPLLLTKPGWVGADTKTYLYLDPARLLADAPYVWHSQIGMGTVTHQNIGYLFPMGPYYFIMDALGSPDWVAQRLWLGSILFGAAMGVRYLAGTLTPAWRLHAPGAVLVASLAYMLSPYFLAYAARISVILLPWAALPWLMAFTARSLRQGGWRYPALFAFAVLVVGGINATALLLVGLGPLLWVLWAVLVEREVTWRKAAEGCARIGVLTVATSLWWLAGLWASGRYGLPVLRYTETYRTVAEVSSATEVTRGLGYWFFYGGDKLGPWIEPSVSYTQNLPLIALSFAIPAGALTAAALLRWRYRGLFLLLFFVGGLTAVAAHPWDDPSFLGGLFATASRTDAGLSMRSTPRAVPLLALAVAMLAGACTAGLARRIPRGAPLAVAAVSVLLVANVPALWTGALVADNLKRPESIPTWWEEAAAHLDDGPHSTRVLELPGSDFASYRWGNTVDPLTPGLMDRPYVARELFQWGSPQSANLLNAFDRRLHEDVGDPEAVATIAQLLGVGEIVVRSDLQYERYRIARPRLLWDHLGRSEGLGAPIGFGPAVPNEAGPDQPLLDEVEFGTPPGLEDPPPVAAIPVLEALPILRTVRAEHPLVIAGDGEGIVDAASIGVLSPTQAILAAATVVGDAELSDYVRTSGADLVITDTNRRRSHRWGALRENTGYTERPGEQAPIHDPSDQRLEVFGDDLDDDSATVAVLRTRPDTSIAAVATATAYGNPITFTPDDRPANAIDGDPQTAWRVGAIDEARGERLRIELAEQLTTGEINLVQPVNLERNRWITVVRLHFDDGGPPVDVELTDESRDESAVGQDIAFETRTFTNLELEVLDTNVAVRPRYDGFSGVGFAEVRLDGVGIEQLVRPPVDLLGSLGTDSDDHRLTWVLTRLRSNPAEPVRLDEEPGMSRLLELPSSRSFSLQGQARLSAYVDDELVDRLLGMPDHLEGGVSAGSSNRLPGSFRHRASAAIDGDLTTHWSPIFGQQREHFVHLRTAEPITFDRLELAVVADGRHSVPTRLRFETPAGDSASTPAAAVDLPAIIDGNEPGQVVVVPLQLDAQVTTDELTVVVERVRQVPTRDWYSNGPNIAPVAIADLGIDGITAPAPGPEIDTGCRSDLLRIDDEPVPLQVSGSTVAGLDRRSLEVRTCDDAEVTLLGGETVLRSVPGRNTGIDLDRLRLASAAGGETLDAALLPRELDPGPELDLEGSGRVSEDATIDATEDPYWLVLGQSYNDGWSLEVDGADAGSATLINGYANGWYLEPSGEGTTAVSLAWAPQRVIWVALALSALAALACLFLVARSPGRTEEASEGFSAHLDQATLRWPPLAAEPRWSWPAALAVAGATFAVSLVNLPSDLRLAAAVPLSLVALAAMRWRRGRDLAVALAGVCAALAGTYVVLQQYRHQFPADFAWPAQFDRAHVVALCAMMLAAVAAVRDGLDRRTGVGGSPTETEPSTPVEASDVAPWEP